jgi:hypothetical protein
MYDSLPTLVVIVMVLELVELALLSLVFVRRLVRGQPLLSSSLLLPDWIWMPSQVAILVLTVAVAAGVLAKQPAIVRWGWVLVGLCLFDNLVKFLHLFWEPTPDLSQLGASSPEQQTQLMVVIWGAIALTFLLKFAYLGLYAFTLRTYTEWLAERTAR